MAQNTIRRLAASILGVGESKIWFDNSKLDKIDEALTRDDVRQLIKDGAVVAKPKMGVSRARARAKQAARKLGRRRSAGSRKGTSKARTDPKETWMAKVRAQRKLLATLVGEGRLAKSESRSIYLKIKGNAFKGKQNLLTYLKEGGMLKEAAKK